MPRLPQAILFDLDDTIISAYGRPELAWSAVIAEFPHSLEPKSQQALLAAVQASAVSFWADPDQHRVWRQKLREARREIVGRAFNEMARQGTPVPALGIQHALADRFSDYRDEQMHIFPEAHATIDALKASGVKLALITNGDGEGQRAKVERFDLAHRFHHIQIEGEHGFGKPEPRAYTHAMAALGVVAQDTWMVGDNLEWEVVAPQKLGIHAIWYDPHGAGLPEGSTVKPDRVVRKLSELLE
ncbi:MAG: HAD family hydrolase [Rhizomicrobium sp.]|jgi:putative hydrolase of the HAD superfamily